MSYTSHPIWPFPHNWSEELLETLEFKTDVLVGETGNEQRVSRRATPRRSFEASFLLRDEELQYYENLIATYGSSTFVLPVWHAITRTTAVMQALIHEIPLGAQYREYRDNEWIILRGATPQAWEAHTVESVENDRINFVAGVSDVYTLWPQGTVVYPGILAKIEETARSTKKTDRAAGITVRFVSAQPNPYESDWSPPTFAGAPVLETSPDDSEDLTFEHQHLLSIVDNAVGLPSVYNVGNRQFKSHTYRWSVIGREKANELRRALYWLRGRAKAIWLPTFMQDLTLVAPTTVGAVNMVIKNAGYAQFLTHQKSRSTVQVQLHSGAVYYRTVIAAAAIDSTKEILGLSESWPMAFSPAEVARISYMLPARLDQDTVEINHPTDIDGVSQCLVTWKEFGVSEIVESFFDTSHYSRFESPFEGIGLAVYETPYVYPDDPWTNYIYNPILEEFWVSGYNPFYPVAFNGDSGIVRVSAATGAIVGIIRHGKVDGQGYGSWPLGIVYNPYRGEVYLDIEGHQPIAIDAATAVILREYPAWPQVSFSGFVAVSPIDSNVLVLDAQPPFLNNFRINCADPASGTYGLRCVVQPSYVFRFGQFFDKNNNMWDAVTEPVVVDAFNNPQWQYGSISQVRKYGYNAGSIETIITVFSDAAGEPRRVLTSWVYASDTDTMWIMSLKFTADGNTRLGCFLHEFDMLSLSIVNTFDISAYGVPYFVGSGNPIAYDSVNKAIWYTENTRKVVGVRTSDGSLFKSVDLSALIGALFTPTHPIARNGEVWVQCFIPSSDPSYDTSSAALIRIFRQC